MPCTDRTDGFRTRSALEALRPIVNTHATMGLVLWLSLSGSSNVCSAADQQSKSDSDTGANHLSDVDSPSTTGDPSGQLVTSEQVWKSQGWPLLQSYCNDCHNEDYQEAEVDLSVLDTLAGVQSHPELASHAISMIRFAAMPPEDAELPSVEERRQLADLLDDLVYQSTCDLRPKPGRVTARRLNRAEYNNAIRDLFQTDFKPADDFPSDEVGGGFDNNADVLSVSTMLMEKYLAAAESVAKQVIVDPSSLPSVREIFADQTLNVIGETKLGSYGERYLHPDAMVWVEVEIEVAGDYKIQMTAARNVEGGEGEEVLSRLYDGQGILRCTFAHQAYDHRGRNGDDTETIHLEPGRHRFFVLPTDHMADQQQDLPAADWTENESLNQRILDLDPEIVQDSVLKPGQKLLADRDIDAEQYPFKIRSLEITGPTIDSRGDLPPTQRRLLPKIARQQSDHWSGVEKAARECLKPIMRRAFRREVDDKEVTPYAELAESMTDQGDSYYAAMQHALTAVLVSPSFLFRVELPQGDEAEKLAAQGEAIPLSSEQLASRVSFFLHSSIPDDQLLDSARKDQLQKRDQLIAEVRRLLADPKSQSLGKQFASQWFGLGNLNSRDMAAFELQSNGFESGKRLTAEDLAAETQLLFRHVLENNLPVGELLTADYTFISEPLARWYGVDWNSGEGDSPTEDGKMEVRQISMADSGRRGILGHAGVLMLTSYPTRNSPVLRGKWILENVLGTPPPDPPPNVPELDETKHASEGLTLRQQLEMHRADPGCASCHRVMDQLGFGLETMDHLGRLRDSDDPSVADAHGQLPGGLAFNGADELSQVLADTEKRRFADTAVRRLLSFAIGRELRPADRCFVESILDATEAEGYRLRDLIEAVIQSPPFLNHEVELPAISTNFPTTKTEEKS